MIQGQHSFIIFQYDYWLLVRKQRRGIISGISLFSDNLNEISFVTVVTNKQLVIRINKYLGYCDSTS